MRRCLFLAALCASCSSPYSAADAGYTAQDLVAANTYMRLVFELDAVTGQAPPASAVNAWMSQLVSLQQSGHLGKPGGVATVNGAALPASSEADHAYTIDELVALAGAHRSYAPARGEAVVEVLFVDGHYIDDTAQGTVLGLAHDHSVIVVFAKSVADSCRVGAARRGADSLCGVLEASVLLHETG